MKPPSDCGKNKWTHIYDTYFDIFTRLAIIFNIDDGTCILNCSEGHQSQTVSIIIMSDMKL